jgi:hypothetical protein
MKIGKDVTGNVHDNFEVLFGLEQKIKDDIMTTFEVPCGLEQILK